MLNAKLLQIKQRTNDPYLQEQDSNTGKNNEIIFFRGVYKIGIRPTYIDKLINLTNRSMMPTIEKEIHCLLNCDCYKSHKKI